MASRSWKCAKEHNISEVSFHRWKRQFGQMDVNEARRLKELERENSELKKMLAESLLKNRVLEAVCEKTISPGWRRQVAREVVEAGWCSGRAACRILRLSRSTYWYQGRPPTHAQEQLRKRLLELSERHPRYGYWRIAALLREEGWRVGKRQIQRLRRLEGLRVPPTKRKVARRGMENSMACLIAVGCDWSEPSLPAAHRRTGGCLETRCPFIEAFLGSSRNTSAMPTGEGIQPNQDVTRRND